LIDYNLHYFFTLCQPNLLFKWLQENIPGLNKKKFKPQYKKMYSISPVLFHWVFEH
jgi:hypothetical protein